MDAGISFWVPGDPAAKGSRTQKHTPSGKVMSWEQNKGVPRWMKAVEAETALWPTVNGTMEPPYRVQLDFKVVRPKKPTFDWPVKGDLDKFVRATLDAMQKSGLISDDKHVVDLSASKSWAHRDAGATVTVWSLQKPQ